MVPSGELKESYNLTPLNRYVYETGYYTGQVLNQIERIDQAGVLLNSYPKIKAWQTRYGRFEYFQYHLEQYFIAVAGLVDRLLLLINQIYGLKIDDGQVRFSSVKVKLRMGQHEEFILLLDEIIESMKEVKKSKNSYTHSQRFWERKLWHIGLLELAVKDEIVPDSDGYLKEDLKGDIRLYQKEKTEWILKNEKALQEMLTLLFESFYTEYLSRIKIARQRVAWAL